VATLELGLGLTNQPRLTTPCVPEACIVRAERNYEMRRWMAYNCQFRWEVLARRNLDWSTKLYCKVFTKSLRSIPRCTVCLINSH